MATTYSFGSVNCVISHPLVGQKTVNGLGIGKITTEYTDDLTDSDIGNDGQTMISKMLSHRGKVTFDIQQTSSLNKWLINLVNAAVNADASSWAQATITINENFANGITTIGQDVAPIKRPPHTDDQKGGRVTWEFFVGNLIES
jgi:hypothetical protein